MTFFTLTFINIDQYFFRDIQINLMYLVSVCQKNAVTGESRFGYHVGNSWRSETALTALVRKFVG